MQAYGIHRPMFSGVVLHRERPIRIIPKPSGVSDGHVDHVDSGSAGQVSGKFKAHWHIGELCIRNMVSLMSNN